MSINEHQTRPETRPSTLVEGLEMLGSHGALSPGLRLGPYRLLEQLGQGGMGEVWLADQLEPFNRKVAIKLSNQMLGAGLAQAYFEVERQAMAQMLHPYIAQIYDAGATPSGALYFAMEYVEGTTLDRHAQTHRPNLDSCAALVAMICQGVHYAHQRGLIHRDLKPGNVLVAQVNGKAMPKIIDFGIAIGVDSARVASTGASAGTRAYMAPEQLQSNAQGLDVRVDVYALGAILVETLCDAVGIRLDAVDSNSFRSLLETGTAVDQNTREPAAKALLQRVPKSLRAIASKAMAVDRNQRYDSAAALAEDLQRWRDRRPVLARGGGRIYAVSCFINRYRLASGLGTVTLLALVVGLFVASYGLREAQRARALAETRREQAEGLIGYMLGDFASKLKSIRKLDLIDGVANRALKYLQQANDTDAHSAIQRAAALRTIGDIQVQRGLPSAAKSAFALADKALNDAEALGPASAELLFEQGQVAFWNGRLHYEERNFAEAKIEWQRYLMFAQRLQPLTPDNALGLSETAYALNSLGSLAFEQGELTVANSAFDQVINARRRLLLSKPTDSILVSDLASSISWRAKTLEASGDLHGALKSYQEQLDLCLSVLSSDQESATWLSAAANARHWIGLAVLQLGDIARARSELDSAAAELLALHVREPEQREWHRALAVAYSNSSWAWLDASTMEKSHEQIGAALDLFAQMSPPLSTSERRGLAVALQRASLIAEARGDHTVAAAQHQKARKLLQDLLQEHPSDRKVAISLASVLLDDNALPEDLKFARSTLEPLATKQPDAEVLDVLVRTYLLLQEWDLARNLQRRLDKIGYRHPSYLAFLSNHQPPGANK